MTKLFAGKTALTLLASIREAGIIKFRNLPAQCELELPVCLSLQFHLSFAVNFLIKKLLHRQPQILGDLLRSLPDYFGYEPTVLNYCQASLDKSSSTFVGLDEDGVPVGFALLSVINVSTTEILAAGVLAKFQRQGLGSSLIRRLEQETTIIGRKYLLVKTYGPSQVDHSAKQAMNFLLKNDFCLLAEYDYIWQDNYCGLMVKEV